MFGPTAPFVGGHVPPTPEQEAAAEESAAAAAGGEGGGKTGATVIKVFKKIADILKKVLEFAQIDKLFKFITSIKDLILSPAFQIFTDILGGLGKIFKAILTPLKPFFKLLEIIGTFLSAVLSPLIPLIWDSLGPAIEDMFSLLDEGQDTVRELSAELLPFLEDLGPIIVNLAKSLIDPVFLKSVIDMVATFLRKLPAIFDSIPDWLELATIIADDLIGENLEDLIYLADEIAKILPDIMRLGNWLVDMAKAISDTFKNMFGGFGTWFEVFFALLNFKKGQKGLFTSSPTLVMTSEHGQPEFIFTEQQTRALADMGIGENTGMIAGIEENNRLLKKLIKILTRGNL